MYTGGCEIGGRGGGGGCYCRLLSAIWMQACLQLKLLGLHYVHKCQIFIRLDSGMIYMLSQCHGDGGVWK